MWTVRTTAPCFLYCNEFTIMGVGMKYSFFQIHWILSSPILELPPNSLSSKFWFKVQISKSEFFLFEFIVVYITGMPNHVKTVSCHQIKESLQQKSIRYKQPLAISSHSCHIVPIVPIVGHRVGAWTLSLESLLVINSLLETRFQAKVSKVCGWLWGESVWGRTTWNYTSLFMWLWGESMRGRTTWNYASLFIVQRMGVTINQPIQLPLLWTSNMVQVVLPHIFPPQSHGLEESSL